MFPQHTHIPVQPLDHGSVDLHVSGRDAALFLVESFPALGRRLHAIENGIIANQSHGLHTGNALSADLCPASVVFTLVFAHQ